MPRFITIRFYRLHRAQEGGPSFVDELRRIAEHPLAERVHDLGNGVIVRLDQFRPDGDFVAGEAVLLQNQNLPSLVPGHGHPAEALDLRGGNLGHGAAFCFHMPTSTLAIEAAPEMSVARLNRYVSKMLGIKPFVAFPIVRKDAWERFIKGHTKYLEIQTAPVDGLASLESEDLTLKETVRNLKSAYGGAIFTVKIAMGSGSEAEPINQKSVIGMVRSYLPLLGRRREVRALKVKLEGDDISKIDFLIDQLKERHSVDLPDGDPKAHYAKRELLLRSVLTRNLPQIGDQGHVDDDGTE